MKEHYINATIALLNAGKAPAEVFDGLDVILKKRGHQALLPSIAAGVLRTIDSGSHTSTATLTVANEATLKTLKSEIESALKVLAVEDKPEVVIDETIIGGFVATTSDRTHDASYKRKLVDLYRSITS